MTPIRGGANGTGSNGGVGVGMGVGMGVGVSTNATKGSSDVRDQFERDVAAVATAMTNGRISGGGGSGGVGSGPSSAFEHNYNSHNHRRVSGTTAAGGSGSGGGSGVGVGVGVGVGGATNKVASTGPLLTSSSSTWKSRDELVSQSGHGLASNEIVRSEGPPSRCDPPPPPPLIVTSTH